MIVEPDTGWHWDKRVPIALLLAIVSQFGGFIYVWADTQNAIKRNSSYAHEARLAGRERDKKLERLITMEADLKHMRRSLVRLESTIDKILAAELERGERAQREASRRQRRN